MGKKLGVLALGILLVSGLWVRGSFGQTDEISEPVTLELYLPGCLTNDDDPATRCHVYLLRDESRRPTGNLTQFQTPIFDADGTEIGRDFLNCFTARGTGTLCTEVIHLRPGPYTQRGKIVITGIAGKRSPITGGAGAYETAHGSAVADVVKGEWVLNVNFIP